MSEWPVRRPADWLKWVNEPQTAKELDAPRESVRCDRLFGGAAWRVEPRQRSN